jgi:serine-type D-Ala-D-Ala carboxypeptidase (penicillin-binding protein 5/6)
MKVVRLRWALVAAAVVAALLAVNEFRPVAAAAPTQSIPSSSTGSAATPVPWPSGGQSALGTANGNLIALTPGAKPAPIASVAKVMTALVVLDVKPLKKGEKGPTIGITAEDVADFQQRKSQGESVVAVQAGEQLSEYQALQGLLIPSGNNLATTLARWAAGSLDAFVKRMNDKARALHLTNSTFADPSGAVDRTVSTPADLIRLGAEALNSDVLVDVMSQQEVSLPLNGTTPNVNYALGKDGIFGIKTGNIPSGGAIFLFAGNVDLSSGGRVVVIGAVQGLPTLQGALDSGRALLRAAHTSLERRQVVSHNQTVGRYSTPWGAHSDVVSTADLTLLLWSGTVVRLKLEAAAVDSAVAAGSEVGKLHVTAGDAAYDVSVVTTDGMPAPSFGARLTRLGW